MSQYAVYSLSWIGKIACEPSNKLVIEQFLNVMNSITFEVAKTNKSEYNDSVYTAAIYWYLETIFGLDSKTRNLIYHIWNYLMKFFFTPFK